MIIDFYECALKVPSWSLILLGDQYTPQPLKDQITSLFEKDLLLSKPLLKDWVI
jgi:hypothetical protein